MKEMYERLSAWLRETRRRRTERKKAAAECRW